MGLWNRGDKQPVSTVEVSLFSENRGTVTWWVQEGDRAEVGYHSILHFMTYYSRLLYFLSYRPGADELVERMTDAVHKIAAAGEGETVAVSGDWQLLEQPEGDPRVTWSSQLMRVAPKKYRLKQQRPTDPIDADAQGVALLFFQYLLDRLGPLERAHLALGIAGMHEYYSTIKHWGNSKTRHAAIMHGMAYAQRTLQGR